MCCVYIHTNTVRTLFFRAFFPASRHLHLADVPFGSVCGLTADVIKEGFGFVIETLVIFLLSILFWLLTIHLVITCSASIICMQWFRQLLNLNRHFYCNLRLQLKSWWSNLGFLIISEVKTPTPRSNRTPGSIQTKQS